MPLPHDPFDFRSNPEYARIDDLIERYLEDFASTQGFLRQQASVSLDALDIGSLVSMYDMMLVHEAHRPRTKQQKRAYRNFRKAKRLLFRTVISLYEDVVSGFPDTISIYLRLEPLFLDIVPDAEPLVDSVNSYSEEQRFQSAASRAEDATSVVQDAASSSVPLSYRSYRLINMLEGRYHSDFNQRYKAAAELSSQLSGEERRSLHIQYREIKESCESGILRRKIASGELDPSYLVRILQNLQP